MRFITTDIPEVRIIELEPFQDERGFLARAFSVSEFAEQGLVTHIEQCNVSFNHRGGTLRGFHYQKPPYAEVKIVRCVRGAVLDVALDLRADSSTRGKWVAAELTAENRRALYVPQGFGHAFQTLEDDTELIYFTTAPYHKPSEAGVRWNDPALDIEWPLPVSVISEKDRAWPDLDWSP